MTLSTNEYPSLPDTLYDTFLEENFRRLDLSPPSHQSPFRPSPSINMPNPNISYEHIGWDFHDLRVQSAVRGERGLYEYPRHPQDSSDFTQDNLEGYGGAGMHAFNPYYTYNYDYLDAVYNRRRNLGAMTNRYSATARPWDSLNQFNGFRLENQVPRRGSSAINSFESGNSSTLRSRQRLNFGPLQNFRGRMVLLAKDQHGCRFLQKKFDEGNPEEIGLIFFELQYHIKELMVDQFGNYLIQKVFEICNEDQMTQILVSVASHDNHFLAICLDVHGTRSMQKLLNHLTMQEQRNIVVSVLIRNMVTMTNNVNGHHVVQHCLKLFSNEDVKHIVEVVANNLMDIAKDKNGCVIMLKCLRKVQGEALDRLVVEIIANAYVLSEDAFGNFSVQDIVGLKIPRIIKGVLAQLAGNHFELSTNKYGSIVVEKCLKEAAEHQSSQIIEELMNNLDFLSICLHPFGNYVAKSSLLVLESKMQGGRLHKRMVAFIEKHKPILINHPYGKNLLSKGRRKRV